MLISSCGRHGQAIFAFPTHCAFIVTSPGLPRPDFLSSIRWSKNLVVIMSNCPIETDFSALLFRPYTGYSEGRQGILKRILRRVLNKSRSDPTLLNCTRPWRNWIAHRSSEPRVVGSNPTGRAFFGHLPTPCTANLFLIAERSTRLRDQPTSGLKQAGCLLQGSIDSRSRELDVTHPSLV